MESIATSLLTSALKAAAFIALPVVVTVALVGVVVGILQTLVQVQDQNVAFAPKLMAVAIFVWLAGGSGLALLVAVLVDAIHELPSLSHA